MEKRMKLVVVSLIIIGTLLMAGCNEANPDKVMSEY